MAVTGRGVGEVVDDVDLVLAFEFVEQVGDDPGQVVAYVMEEPGAVRRSERPHRRIAQPVMFGRVMKDEAGRHSCVLFGHGGAVSAGSAVAQIVAQSRVVGRAPHLVVRADEVGAVVLRGYRRLAQFGIEGVGIGAIRVVGDLRGHGAESRGVS
ncbi:hypothetical protein [Streptomyces sp. NPDC101150]|uniref:hypothetical protein n=1 Tax=Streptomyces sp. NPDC101150 TaxID=3366114 RepID=UPI0038141111